MLMEIQHRYFVQYMLKNGVVPVEKALNYCQNIPNGALHDITQLKLLIITTNREISRQGYKIAFVTCEVTNQELLVFVNTRNDNISKLQITFSPIELEYFHVVMQEILNSEDNRLTFVVVLNITSTLTATFSRDKGQKVLNKWLKGGYFTKLDGFVYLGPRLIVEFTSYLKSHRPDHICKLCSELVFTGRRCGICDRLLHSYCLAKYLTNLSKCPSCKKPWVEKQTELIIPTSQEIRDAQDNLTQSSLDSEMDVDSQEPIPGTSTGILENSSQGQRRSNRKRNS